MYRRGRRPNKCEGLKIHQLGRANAEGIRQSADIDQPNVAKTALDTAQVASSQSTIRGKLFLRAAELAPDLRESFTKLTSGVSFHIWARNERPSYETVLFKTTLYE